MVRVDSIHEEQEEENVECMVIVLWQNIEIATRATDRFPCHEFGSTNFAPIDLSVAANLKAVGIDERDMLLRDEDV